MALVAMAEDGCTDTAIFAITVNDEVLFYVPNSFIQMEMVKMKCSFLF